MRVMCMLPAGEGVYPEVAAKRRLKVMESYATPDIEIHAEYMPGVSGFSPWGGKGGPEGNILTPANSLAADLAQRAEREGYDAFCPYGMLDIGIKEARRRGVKIPVVGQSEAAILYCGMLGRRFASCSYMPGSGGLVRSEAAALGLEHLYVADTAIGIPNSEYPERRQEVLENFVRCTREAREQGAEIMGWIAMSICPGEFPAKELMAASGFPVLDALAGQIAMASWFHRTGLPFSLLRTGRNA